MGRAKARIFRNRRLKQIYGVCFFLACAKLMKMIDAALIQLPGVEALRRRVTLALKFRFGNLGLNGSGDDLGDLVLNG
ncbi:MAG: hypothetical protein ACKVGZ_18995 [Alphaproteobacteria bacterium]|jgi:hypothetical protein